MSDGRVRYARNGDARLAYRAFGDGDSTLVWIPGWFSNVATRRKYAATRRSKTPIRIVITVVAFAVLLMSVGCNHSTTTRPTTTSAVTAPDPGLGPYTRLKQIEQQRPDRITAAIRSDYPWAFDQVSGRLVEYREAYRRGAGVNCMSACVQAGFREMLGKINAGIEAEG